MLTCSRDEGYGSRPGQGRLRVSGQRRSGREVSAAEARPLIGAHLRGRKGEIEQELLAQVDAFSRDDSVDPEYALGLRDSVSIALEYGFQCIESSELSAPPVPTPLYAQARLAARNGVELDTVLGRYFQGYTLLEAFVEEAAEAHGLVGSMASREIRRVSSALVRRLIGEIGEQYKDEVRKQASSPESTRIKQVRELLDGKPIDTTRFNYDFGSFHVGLVAKGPGVARAMKGLGEALDCISMVFEPPDAPTWAWLGRRTPPDISSMEELVSKHWPAESALAVGEIGKGLAGWRLTHHQASAGLLVSLKRSGGFFRYGDDPILAALLQDNLFAESLRQMYLVPLSKERDGGKKLIKTLRAYCVAKHNGASAAKALKVTRQTVMNRLRTVEDKLGRPLSGCMAELEAALRLDRLWQ